MSVNGVHPTNVQDPYCLRCGYPRSAVVMMSRTYDPYVGFEAITSCRLIKPVSIDREERRAGDAIGICRTVSISG